MLSIVLGGVAWCLGSFVLGVILGKSIKAGRGESMKRICAGWPVNPHPPIVLGDDGVDTPPTHGMCDDCDRLSNEAIDAEERAAAERVNRYIDHGTPNRLQLERLTAHVG